MNKIKTTNIDRGAKTDIEAINEPKDYFAGALDLQGILDNVLNEFRHIPLELVRGIPASAYKVVQNIIVSLNRELSTYEVLANQCFVSELVDEWLKDSHCLDNQEAWDADPRRPFRFNEVMAFIDKHKPFDGEDLKLWMTGAALQRITVIGRSVDISRTLRLSRVVGQVSHGKSQEISKAMDYLAEAGLCVNDADTFLRCVSLYLKVCRGEWPFEYVGPSRISEADQAS